MSINYVNYDLIFLYTYYQTLLINNTWFIELKNPLKCRLQSHCCFCVKFSITHEVCLPHYVNPISVFLMGSIQKYARLSPNSFFFWPMTPRSILPPNDTQIVDWLFNHCQTEPRKKSKKIWHTYDTQIKNHLWITRLRSSLDVEPTCVWWHVVRHTTLSRLSWYYCQ